MYSLSIILPFIDEFNSLKKTIEIINSRIKTKKEFLIIVSRKKTSKEIIKKISNIKKNKYIKIYYQKEPLVGGAIKTGIFYSKNTHIVIMASDLETNPNDLAKMVKLSKKNTDYIICANRWHNKGGIKNYGITKKIFNYLFQNIVSFFFKSDLKDFTFAYRLYPAKILKNYKYFENNHSFALEMILKPMRFGYKTINVPTVWKPRVEGSSHNSILYYYDYLKVLLKNIILK